MKKIFRVKFALLLGVIILDHGSFATPRASWAMIEKNFKKSGGDLKALSHVKCFFNQYTNDVFSFKRPRKSLHDKRCYSLEASQYTHPCYFTVIDYIKSGFKRRMFLVDTLTGSVKAMGVAHSNINPVIDALKGEQEGISLTKSDGLVFIYGPREREWGYNQCPISKL